MVCANAGVAGFKTGQLYETEEELEAAREHQAEREARWAAMLTADTEYARGVRR